MKDTKQYDNFYNVANADNLCKAFKKSKKGVSWKESVQRYEANLLTNVLETKEKLLNGEDIRKGFVEFDINERGKTRHIKSVHISERVVQKCFCDEVLLPILTRPLIYDNGASIKGKGVSFALNRLTCHLRRFYRANGFSNSGYALIIDFKSYFDNIAHRELALQISPYLHDKRCRSLLWSFIASFGEKGLGLGSEISQICAVFYPNKIDHFIKEKLHIKYYGRYMDDSYLIHSDKAYLQNCLKEIKAICSQLKITLNEKKTKIVKLSNGLPFLKGRYVLTETGKILKFCTSNSIVRMKRKLKKFKRLLDEGKISAEDIRTSYQSWKGSYQKRFDDYYRIKRLDKFYDELFINHSF